MLNECVCKRESESVSLQGAVHIDNIAMPLQDPFKAYIAVFSELHRHECMSCYQFQLPL